MAALAMALAVGGMTRSLLHRAARSYVERLSLAVFPCWPRGKEPRIPKHEGGTGYKDANLDLEQVDRWWSRWPRANVAIATIGDLFALDIDHRAGGDDELAALLEQHGELPETVEAITGSGGRHILFRCPVGLGWQKCIWASAESRWTANGEKRLTSGVEIKAGGGYIVVAPSIHPCGGTYRWDVEHHPLEVPIAPLPQWLFRAAVKIRRPHQPATGRAGESVLARAMAKAGYDVQPIKGGGDYSDDDRVAIDCPWSSEHTGKSGSSGTIIFAPRESEPRGFFWCSHAHCAGRRTSDVLAVLPIEAISAVLRGNAIREECAA